MTTWLQGGLLDSKQGPRGQSAGVCMCVCCDNKEWQIHIWVLSFPLLSPSSLVTSIHQELQALVHRGCSNG